MQLEGAVALVTGGAGGIGQALVTALRGAGATPITADLPGRGADIAVDVSVPGAMAAAVEGLERLDVVVANAAVAFGGLAEDIDPQLWQQSIDVNIRGVVDTVLPAYARIREQRSGAIVLMASLAGLAGSPLLTPYAMTKSAVVGLGNSLRSEAARYGVGVTTVCPGPVETPMLDTKAESHGMDVRRYLVAVAGPPITPARLADHVIDGIRKNRARVVPGRARVIWAASRFAPRLTDRMIARGLHQEIEAAQRGQPD